MNISGLVTLEYDNVRNKRIGIQNIPVALQVNQESNLTDKISSLGVAALTDNNGYFEFTDVPEGLYRVSQAWGLSGALSGTVSYTTAKKITIKPAIPDGTAFPNLTEKVTVQSLFPASVNVEVIDKDISGIIFINQFFRENANAYAHEQSFIQITTLPPQWTNNEGALQLNDNILQSGNLITHLPNKSEIDIAADSTYLVQYSSTARYSGNHHYGVIHLEIFLDGKICVGGGAATVSVEGLPINLTGLGIIKTQPFYDSVLTINNRSGIKVCFSNTTIIITHLD